MQGVSPTLPTFVIKRGSDRDMGIHGDGVMLPYSIQTMKSYDIQFANYQSLKGHLLWPELPKYHLPFAEMMAMPIWLWLWYLSVEIFNCREKSEKKKWGVMVPCLINSELNRWAVVFHNATLLSTFWSPFSPMKYEMGQTKQLVDPCFDWTQPKT